MEYKTLKRISTFLYLISICLLINDIYRMGEHTATGLTKTLAWGSLMVASIFAIYVMNQKKKMDNNQA